MDREAMRREMRQAIADSRVLRHQTAAAIAHARRFCRSSRETLERQRRDMPPVETDEDDSTDPEPR